MSDPKLTEQLAAEAAETEAVLNETEQPEPPAKIPTYFKPNRHDRRTAAAKRRRKKDKK